MSNKFRIWSIILPLCAALAGCTAEDEPEAVQPDSELSELEEINWWIYSTMDHYYLWREDLPDPSACDFSATPKEFYESLISPQDRFSYFSQKSRGPEPDPGFAWQTVRGRDGASYQQILFVKSKEALNAGLRRGDIVRFEIKGASRVAVTKFNYTGGRLAKGETVEYSNFNTRAALNATVQLDSVYHILGKRIGYMCYLEYDNADDLYESFKKFKDNNIDELILDLRYNPGGLVATCKRLCNMIVPEEAYDKMFQQCSYNDIIAAENLEKFGDERTYTFFSSPAGDGPVLGKRFSYLGMKRIFVLTSSHTASASEATINSLQPYMDVVVIGENTVGKGVGMQTLTSSRHKYALVPITFAFYNANGVTIPYDGIVPDYYVPDGYSTHKKDLGDLSEPMLAKAMELILPHYEPLPAIREPERMPDGFLTPVGAPSYVEAFERKRMR